MDYKYLGDKATSSLVKGKACRAIQRQNAKCIRGKNGNMLIALDGQSAVVIATIASKAKLMAM